GASGKSYIGIESTENGSNAAFAVLDFNTNGYEFAPDSVVGAINEISVSTYTGYPIASFQRSGLFNVYLVDDTTTSIDNGGSSPLTFDPVTDPVEGLGSQLGTKHLLGTINYNAVQPFDNFTSFPLTSTNASTLNLLRSDLNSNIKFRM